MPATTSATNTSTTSSTDRIEKQVQLSSPQSRVWRALTDAKEFGKWFGVEFHGAFAPKTSVNGRLTAKGYDHLNFEFVIDKIEPERFFSFRWHPFAIDPNVDYSNEPMTLVTFTLEPADGGTLLRVVETGFDKIPAARRVKAFEMNASGWEAQTKNIQKYLAANA
jgi:uncharacterized protein YndB with AHSA1/START domain